MFRRFFKTNKPTVAQSMTPGSVRSAGESVDGVVIADLRPIDVALQHHRAGRLPEAEAAYREVLAVDPGNIDALHFSGVIAYQHGEHERAADLISQALSWNTSNAPAHNNLGNVFRAQGKLDEAIACFRKAITLQPEYADAYINLGIALGAQGKLEEAVMCYQSALLVAPDVPTIHSDLGLKLVEQGKLEEAIACFRKALALKPDYPEAQCNLGAALYDQGKLEDAVTCYRKALALRPNFSEAYYNLGTALKGQGWLEDAVTCYRKALALSPNFPEAYYNLGDTLREQGRHDEAIACLERVFELKPDYIEAYFCLGHVFKGQDRRDEALDCYRKALSCNPEYAEAHWALTMAQIPSVYEENAEPGRFRAAFSMKLDELDRWFDSTRIAKGFTAVGTQQPFSLAYQEENNRELLRRYGRLCSRIMAKWFDSQTIAHSRRHDFDGVIRVGVVSQHLWNHSVWNAIVKGWFQQLDRKRFALHAFYLGNFEDEETLFAKTHASHFEQGGRGLRQWVEAIMSQRPDVLIYPEIGMDPMTAKLASLRLAPIQVATWGHPETTGLPTIDYYLSAEDMEPAGAQENYTEQLITLPHLGCFYKPLRVVAVHPDLDSLGIDPESPLLLCPGVPFKYAPQHDWVLTEIARRLGRCQFIFFTCRVPSHSEKLEKRLEAAFARYGLDIDEFVTFIPWQDRPAFYGLMERADVFLDTIGFSGFNTAMQAVECGLPMVTREGRFLRGRLASGILKRMGLQELVAGSEEDYIALVVKLAQDVKYRERIRGCIEVSRHLLWEDAAPIRALEDFLVKATVLK